MTEHRTEGALALAATPPVTRLTCHAPHSDPRKKGVQCGGILGDVPGSYAFVTTAAKAPAQPDGFTWLRCPNRKCDRWNKFRLLPPESPSTALAVRDIEQRFSRLPENQQQALLGLAGGLSQVATAAAVGVDRKTIQRWMADDEFTELRQILAPQISAAHIRTALDTFFAAIEKDRKKGRSGNARWFLSRTVFADFERSRAAARGTNVGVSVTTSQHQEQTESSIKHQWEVRTRGISAAVAPEE